MVWISLEICGTSAGVQQKGKSGNAADILAYEKQCQYVNLLMKEARTNFNSQKICKSKDDKKKLFERAKNIIFLNNNPVLSYFLATENFHVRQPLIYQT